MNAIKQSFYASRFMLVAVALFGALAAFGVIDPATAAMGFFIVGDVEPSNLKELEKAVKETFDTLKGKIHEVQDVATKALEQVRQEGTLHKETNEKLTELSTAAMALQGDFKKVNDRLLEIEQKTARKPGPARSAASGTIRPALPSATVVQQ